MYLYVNGVQKASGTPDSVPREGSFPLLIGKGSTLYLDGMIDEAAIWNTALSSTDISSLYNSGAGTIPSSVQSSSLVAYWPFDTNYNDNKNSHHGTAQGGVSISTN